MATNLNQTFRDRISPAGRAASIANRIDCMRFTSTRFVSRTTAYAGYPRNQARWGAVLIALAAILLLTACPSRPLGRPKPPQTVVGGPVAVWPGDTSSRPDRGGYGSVDLNDPASLLSRRVIYFEYDSSDIQPQFLATLRAHAAYLSSAPAARVTLDGHTDEHGTREYNLALGYYRAGAVRDFLRAEGVPPGRLRTMSYGEERPVAPDHGESAWALNRRVELVY
ncbi:MAG: peptidoglycan-associated lipoprotein Pal [Candidatus Thiosymbion ectosymbiont of Robbea hypermnestra]|nr:peptidoglycan-associated lipoprotein Pal [Candidatus Thiosymbion ectosymbiont of Robbea hypermnestra]